MQPSQPQYGYVGNQKQRQAPPFKIIGLIGGVLVLLVIAIVVMNIFLSQNSIGTQSQHLSARLSNLSTLTTSATKLLTNSELKKLNAETSIITAGTVSELESLFPKKIDANIQSEESVATDTTKLASAKLAGTYDTEYKQVLSQRLESIDALLVEMYNKTTSKATRTSIDGRYKNYQTILTNLNKLEI